MEIKNRDKIPDIGFLMSGICVMIIKRVTGNGVNNNKRSFVNTDQV